MENSKITSNKLNLIGNYKIVKRSTKHDYKARYNKLFPTKMSSSSFLSLYTLFILANKDQPLYGREILTELQKAVSVSVWKPSHGTHYPVLNALMKDGYIENIKTISDKKFYAITKLGKKELELKLGEFRPMLIESYKFFSSILTEMYTDLEDKAVTTNTIIVEDKPKINSNNQVLEMLTTINNEVKELGIKIENQCIEVRVIKPIN